MVDDRNSWKNFRSGEHFGECSVFRSGFYLDIFECVYRDLFSYVLSTLVPWRDKVDKKYKLIFLRLTSPFIVRLRTTAMGSLQREILSCRNLTFVRKVVRISCS